MDTSTTNDEYRRTNEDKWQEAVRRIRGLNQVRRRIEFANQPENTGILRPTNRGMETDTSIGALGLGRGNADRGTIVEGKQEETEVEPEGRNILVGRGGIIGRGKTGSSDDPDPTETERIGNSQTSRCWVCTINNPARYLQRVREETRLGANLWTDVRASAKNFIYGIFQLERASTGHIHLQGYLEYGTVVSFRQLRKIFKDWHLEPRRGTRDSAREYCRKTETRIGGPYEYGTWRPSKKDSATVGIKPLEQVKDLLQKSASEKEIATNHFQLWCRHFRAFERFATLNSEPRTAAPEVYVLAGLPGTGKSTFASTLAPPSNTYHKYPNHWWDGYVPARLVDGARLGHHLVVFDDFSGTLSWTEFKLLCDPSPYRVEVKGNTVVFNSPIIVFTTNKNPMRWYKWTHDPHAGAALKRRVKHWMIFERKLPDDTFGPLSADEPSFVHYDYGPDAEGWKKFDEHLQQLLPTPALLIV